MSEAVILPQTLQPSGVHGYIETGQDGGSQVERAGEGLGWFWDPFKVPLPWKRSWLNKIPISRQIRDKLGSFAAAAQAVLLPGADDQSHLVTANNAILEPITGLSGGEH